MALCRHLLWAAESCVQCWGKKLLRSMLWVVNLHHFTNPCYYSIPIPLQCHIIIPIPMPPYTMFLFPFHALPMPHCYQWHHSTPLTYVLFFLHQLPIFLKLCTDEVWGVRKVRTRPVQCVKHHALHIHVTVPPSSDHPDEAWNMSHKYWFQGDVYTVDREIFVVKNILSVAYNDEN